MKTKIKHFFKEFTFLKIKYCSNQFSHKWLYAEVYFLGIPIYKKIEEGERYFSKKYPTQSF